MGLIRTSVLLKREELGHRDTDTQRECHVTKEADIRVDAYTNQGMVQIASDHHQLGRGKDVSSPGAFRASLTLPTP